MTDSNISAQLNVKLTPRGSRSEIIGLRDGVLCIKLTAPPVENAANKALIDFLSEALAIKKNRIKIVAGHKSRDKILSISGMAPDELKDILRQVPVSKENT